MSAPFAPGDVVVCVNLLPRGGPYDIHAHNLSRLAVGRHYRVTEVGRDFDGEPSIGILVRSDAPGGQWWAGRFRKIDDEVTEAFRERLRSLPKQKVQSYE